MTSCATAAALHLSGRVMQQGATTVKPYIGALLIMLIGAVAGILNIFFYIFVMYPLTEHADEVTISTYAINLFVGWALFSAWFLVRADEEWKKVAESVVKGDRE